MLITLLAPFFPPSLSLSYDLRVFILPLTFIRSIVSISTLGHVLIVFSPRDRIDERLVGKGDVVDVSLHTMVAHVF